MHYTSLPSSSPHRLVDALLASGELALLRGDQITAKRQARKAERISVQREHRTAALVARLLSLRADAVAFDPVRSSRLTPPTRAHPSGRCEPGRGTSRALDEAGLTEDARTASTRVGRRACPPRRSGRRTERVGEGTRGSRKPNLGVRLHHRLVDARIALAAGNRPIRSSKSPRAWTTWPRSWPGSVPRICRLQRRSTAGRWLAPGSARRSKPASRRSFLPLVRAIRGGHYAASGDPSAERPPTDRGTREARFAVRLLDATLAGQDRPHARTGDRRTPVPHPRPHLDHRRGQGQGPAADDHD